MKLIAVIAALGVAYASSAGPTALNPDVVRGCVLKPTTNGTLVSVCVGDPTAGGQPSAAALIGW